MGPEEVLKEIEEAAPREGLPIIGPAKGAVLDEIFRRNNPKTALEIGTLVGYSAIRMARLLPPGGKLVCVEINPRMAQIALSNLSRAGLSKRVEVKVGDAKKVVSGLAEPVDLVLIDARKDEYLEYLHASEHLLHPGSVVVADNVKEFADVLADYLKYVKNSGRYSSTTVDAPLNADPSVIDAMEISVRL